MPAVFVLLWSTGFIVAKFAAPHAPPLASCSGATRRCARAAAGHRRHRRTVAAQRATCCTWPWSRAAAGHLSRRVWWAIAEGMPPALGADRRHAAAADRRPGRGRGRAGNGTGNGPAWCSLSPRRPGAVGPPHAAGAGLAPVAVNVLALAGITAGTLYQNASASGRPAQGSAIQFGASFLVTAPFVLRAAGGR